MSAERNALPVVLIVGRVNVGKSTLFNRLARKTLSITDRTPGVTRDVHGVIVRHAGRDFELLDAGGLEGEGALSATVERSVRARLHSADLVLFVVDAKEGITPSDERIAAALRRADARVLLVANKTDAAVSDPDAALVLGFGEPTAVSAEHGTGCAVLLDGIADALPARAAVSDEERPVPVAIVGRTNAGKSTLLNALVGEETAIVSPTPGTTRDAVEALGGRFRFVDTAGIRRKFPSDIEYYAHLRSEKSVRFAHCAIVLLDATVGVTSVDRRIVGKVCSEGRAMVLALNKTDLAPAEGETVLPPNAAFARCVPISAKLGRGLDALLAAVDEALLAWNARVANSELKRVLDAALTKRSVTTRLVALKYVRASPPTLRLIAYGDELPEHYARFLIKSVRARVSLVGSPVRLLVGKRVFTA